MILLVFNPSFLDIIME